MAKLLFLLLIESSFLWLLFWSLSNQCLLSESFFEVSEKYVNFLFDLSLCVFCRCLNNISDFYASYANAFSKNKHIDCCFWCWYRYIYIYIYIYIWYFTVYCYTSFFSYCFVLHLNNVMVIQRIVEFCKWQIMHYMQKHF